MKNRKLFFTLSLFYFCFICSLKAQTNRDIFHKKWKAVIDIKKVLKNMPAEQKEAYKQLSPQQQKRIQNDMLQQAQNSSFEFRSDHTFEITVKGDRTYQGTWEISADGKTIIARTKEGVEEQVYIKTMKPDLLILSSSLKGAKNDLVLVPEN